MSVSRPSLKRSACRTTHPYSVGFPSGMTGGFHSLNRSSLIARPRSR